MLMRVWCVGVVLLTGCVGVPGADGGGDGGAGLPDASASADAAIGEISLTAEADELAVRLQWQGEPSGTHGWVVLRDSMVLATLPAAARTYVDSSAVAGRLSSPRASATVDLPEGVELEWSTPSSEAGDLHHFEVREAGRVSNAVFARRAAPHVVGYRVERGDAGWELDASSLFWLDTTAPLPDVLPGELRIAVRPDDWTTSVVLQATSDAGRTLEPVDYALVALASSGVSLRVAVTGSRGGNRVEYQWQRSTADAPTNFVDLPFVHGLTWLDRDAVLSEGRYYRLVARAGGQSWESAPSRAELRRPIALADGRYLLRDDLVVLDLFNGVTTQLAEPIRDLDSHTQGFIGVTDAGRVLLGATVLPYTGVRSVKASEDSLWLNYSDGTVELRRLPQWTAQPTRLSDIDHLIDAVGYLVCGVRFDGGVQCDHGFFAAGWPVAVATPYAGVWVDEIEFFVADPFGGVTAYNMVGAPFVPPFLNEGVAYVGGLQRYGDPNCALRADGYVRCVARSLASSGEREAFPSVSNETYRSYGTGSTYGHHGLTLDDRLRVYGPGTRYVPPRPPVKQVQAVHASLVALQADGRISVTRQVVGALAERFDDRFVALSPGWGVPPSLNNEWDQCGLRADGLVRCAKAALPDGGRYSQITRRAGLRLDGGVDNWTDGGAHWAGHAVVELVEHLNPSTLCARFGDGGWSCDPEVPLPPGAWAMLALSATGGCALSARGQLECWPDAAPPELAGRRFRHVSVSRERCATTLEGEVLCVVDGGVVSQLPWDDFVSFEDSEMGCGLRQDGNVACRDSNGWGLEPWR